MLRCRQKFTKRLVGQPWRDFVKGESDFVKGIDKKAKILTSMKAGESGGEYFNNDRTFVCWADVREPKPARRRESARARTANLFSWPPHTLVGSPGTI